VDPVSAGVDATNVVVIVVDCLRSDYAEPLKAELAKLGFTAYSRVVAPAPWTVPSHASMLTGLYPTAHGAHETRSRKSLDVRLQPGPDLLSLELRERGYTTWLLSANSFLQPKFGFVGFDHAYVPRLIPHVRILSPGELREIVEIRRDHGARSRLQLAKALLAEGRPGLLIKALVNRVVKNACLYLAAVTRHWPRSKGAVLLIKELDRLLRRRPREPLFILMNFMELHEPYFLRDPFIRVQKVLWRRDARPHPALLREWRERYRERAEYLAAKVLEVLGILKRWELLNRSLVIVTSDHGQLLGEHGKVGHGVFLYEELLRVPLLIKYPYPVERIDEKGYVSLTKLKRVILDVVDNKLSEDAPLYDEVVFAETHGIHARITDVLSEEERRKLEELERHRVAIYYAGLKGIFNVVEQKFEEVVPHERGAYVSDDAISHMRREVRRFLAEAARVRVRRALKRAKLRA